VVDPSLAARALRAGPGPLSANERRSCRVRQRLVLTRADGFQIEPKHDSLILMLLSRFS
jgi:hypothetical protein